MGVENEDGTVIGGNGAVIDRNGRVDCDLNVQIATRVGPNDRTPASAEEALRLAAKLAIDDGDLDRAVGVVDLLRRGRRPATVTEISVARSEAVVGPRPIAARSRASSLRTEACLRGAARRNQGRTGIASAPEISDMNEAHREVVSGDEPIEPRLATDPEVGHGSRHADGERVLERAGLCGQWRRHCAAANELMRPRWARASGSGYGRWFT
jgi:hypothetical protein